MDPRQALRTTFGFDTFRPGQEAAVQAALRDRDALIVMPTGSGKSLCYQLPALMRSDLTVVVSPLVSLMQDQVQALERIAPGRVALVNAQRAGSLNAETVARAARGEIRLLYVAPERFGRPRFVEAMREARVGLFVVDEAHCVSQWGHDFRPDYFSLAQAAQRLGAQATIGLTATATPRVALDIARRLALRDPVRVTTGFDRPNLALAVVRCATGADKERRLVAALREPEALPAIVYAGTRGAADGLAGSLRARLGEEVLVYHAGLDRSPRAATQERFMCGEARVIVATNAFGMGIDKADVRTVCHATVPGSLEAYYQEAGRAGRDGRPARCLLFAEARDKGLHVFFIERARIAEGAFQGVAERLAWAGADGRYEIGLGELAGFIGARADEDVVRSVLGHLARAGMIAPEPSAPDRAAGRVLSACDATLVARCMAYAKEAERVRWAQYRAVWEYVEGGECRRARLLRHFGDRAAPAAEAGCCDVCDPGLVPAPPPANVVAGPAPAAPASAPPGSHVVPAAPGSANAGGGAMPVDLDSAIVEVVRVARPPVGRTRAVEILRGGRSKVIAEHAYDRLAPYGAFAHLRSDDVLVRVDELLRAGTLHSTGGRFPKLQARAA